MASQKNSVNHFFTSVNIFLTRAMRPFKKVMDTIVVSLISLNFSRKKEKTNEIFQRDSREFINNHNNNHNNSILRVLRMQQLNATLYNHLKAENCSSL